MALPSLTPEQKEAADRVFISLKQSEGMSADQHADRDYLLEDGNLPLFMTYYFPRAFYQWEDINDALFNFFDQTMKGIVRTPGTHGKTTSILRYFIYGLCRCPSLSIIYTEKTEPVALKRGATLLGELNGNKRLIEHYGSFKPEPSSGLQWSYSNFTIAQRPEPGDWPSFQAYGAGGSSVLGQRCNWLFNDDPVTPENSKSEKERGKLLQWWSDSCKTAPAPLPIEDEKYLIRHFLVGTVFRLDDLYHEVMKDPEYESLHLKAVIDEDTGQTLSPRFCYQPPERLFVNPEVENRRELIPRDDLDSHYWEVAKGIVSGKVNNLYTFKYGVEGGVPAYFRRYQNVPLSTEQMQFKEEYFYGGEVDGVEHTPCINEVRSREDKMQDGWLAQTVLDPASGSISASAKRSAVVTLAADPTAWMKGKKRIYLMDNDYGKYPQIHADVNKKTQCKVFVDHCVRFGSRGVIEDNAVQHGLLGSVKVHANSVGAVISVEGFHTGSNKLDPEIGVDSLVPWFERGQIDLPFETPEDQRKTKELVSEFCYYGVYPYTDQVMAFWMALTRLTKRLNAFASSHRKKVEDIPAYRNRLHDFKFPSHWTNEQKEDYLARIMGEGEAQDYLHEVKQRERAKRGVA